MGSEMCIRDRGRGERIRPLPCEEKEKLAPVHEYFYRTMKHHPVTYSQALDGEAADTNEEAAEDRTSSSAYRVDIDDSKAKTSGQRRPSLFRCLARVYGLSLLKAHLCKLVCDVLLFVGPVLQR